MNDSEISNDQTSNDQSTGPPKSWVPAALMVGFAVMLGIVSLALFCYAWGLNFSDEGWGTPDGQAPQVKQIPLIAAVAGTVISTLVFWWGFMRLTRSR